MINGVPTYCKGVVRSTPAVMFVLELSPIDPKTLRRKSLQNIR